MAHMNRKAKSVVADICLAARRWCCPDCGFANQWEAIECRKCGVISPPDRERWEFKPFVRSERERLPDDRKVSRLKRENTIALRREAYPDDITRIQAAIIAAGYDCSRLHAADLWRLYSDSLCAGWIGASGFSTAEGLFACVEPFIEPEDE